MTDKILLSEIAGAKETAELLGMSTAGLSNLRNRYDDFPEPVKKLTATPLFLISEVESWMEAHGRKGARRHLPNPKSGRFKVLAVCGRPRVGKSFLISMFSADTYGYRTACSREGDDFTQCEVQNVVWENLDEGFAVFHSTDETMNGMESPLTPERLTRFLNEVNDYLRECREKGWNGEKGEHYHYIEIFSPPSDFARRIMRANNLDYLIITDTPGVAENYGVVPIEKADLVLFVLADSGMDEAKKSFSTLVEAMAPLVASSKACFLYRTNSSCDDEDEYIQMQAAAERAMKRFEDCFTGLKGRIIESSLDVLQPAESVLGVPIMKDKKSSQSEIMFQQRFEDKICRAFQAEESTDLKAKLSATIQEADVSSNVVIDFLVSLLGGLTNKEDSKNDNYFSQFRDSKPRHNRVKTVDGYRLLMQAQDACRKQLQSLYKYFSCFTSEEYPQTWQQNCIKYIYSVLTKGIKTDIGIGHGGHPFEDRPPVTMLVVEAILAEELLMAFKQAKTESQLYSYQKTFEDNGVQSNSWNYVWVTSHGDGLKKLEIIKDTGLRHRHSNSLYLLVRNCYVGGMQKLAEYQIWMTVLTATGISSDAAEVEAMNALRKTGF
ncbi:helix-turn-helix transcriptional regulator [Aneurinibacillus sp. REN35]|uniref:helix-turn-helix transcriptional regulator n=1 Tax=Aneurinibacillus sp. REN35 TaxID=3237286 RepID=UPI00352837E4